MADESWGEESPACPGWTYHDIVAHIASNEVRRRIRLASALGEASQEELDAINDIDGWNARVVAERRDWPLGRLMDELAAGWRGILEVLSRFKSEDTERPVLLGSGDTITANEFIKRAGAHTSRHAGQLVAGSRGRRVAL